MRALFLIFAREVFFMTNRNILVVGGGVGPEAGTLFHRKIIEMTDNGESGDQGHANLLHVSFSQFVQDRTAYLKLDAQREEEIQKGNIVPNIGLNPGQEMALVVNNAMKGFSQMGGEFVIGVPCNTFHSKKIFDEFTNFTRNPRVNQLNMIQLTAAFLKEKHLNKKIILLSTEGTRDTRVYRSAEIQNLIECNDEQQHIVTQAIYNKEDGIKSNTPDYLKSAAAFEHVVNQIINGQDRNEYCVIMGCTEIPIAYAKLEKSEEGRKQGRYAGCYVDPMDVLAVNMLVAGKYSILPQFHQYEVTPATPPAGSIRLLSKL